MIDIKKIYRITTRKNVLNIIVGLYAYDKNNHSIFSYYSREGIVTSSQALIIFNSTRRKNSAFKFTWGEKKNTYIRN